MKVMNPEQAREVMEAARVLTDVIHKHMKAPADATATELASNAVSAAVSVLVAGESLDDGTHAPPEPAAMIVARIEGACLGAGLAAGQLLYGQSLATVTNKTAILRRSAFDAFDQGTMLGASVRP